MLLLFLPMILYNKCWELCTSIACQFCLYQAGLLNRYWGNHMIALVPGQSNLMTMTKQCAYFMGYIAFFKILKLRQNGSHFAYDYFKSIFSNENVWSSFETSLKYVPKHQNNNIPTLIQIMAWCWPGDKPLIEPMMDTLLMHMRHSASTS